MKLFTFLQDAKEMLGPSVVALGNFDGVHKGHQQLIKKAVEIAKEKDLSSVVFTFTNHPINAIAGKTVVKNIMTFEEKCEAVESLGIDAMVSINFDAHIRKLSPEGFARGVIKKSLHAEYAICGFNYTFGAMAKGTPDELIAFGENCGFNVNVVEEFKLMGATVSSTRIRNLISAGDMKAFCDLTGRNYLIKGKVVQGNRIGRSIGFPTLNVALSDEMALPLNGVYITKTYVNNSIYKSVTNVGNKPTIGQYAKNAETFLFDFQGDLYGQTIRVEFIDLIRPERRFDSLEELVNQIKLDSKYALEYYKNIEK